MFVQLWMTKELVVATEKTTIAEAGVLLQQNKIRRLPVVDETGNLLGILSKEDVSKGMPSIIDPAEDGGATNLPVHARVISLMTAEPITVSPMDPLEKSARIMRRNKIGGIPVVDEGKLVGIITESDIFQAFMEIMGLDADVTRLELVIGNNNQSFYEVIEILGECDMRIHAVSLYKNYSEKQQLLTLRIGGEDMQAAIDALWDMGVKVNSVA